ncbi:MAG: nucleotide sugar dehydrogenase [Candidatus Omnitrophica bacterium]|nr:nucleotide sugar dehydrogenase [Candidatus Omnitrophota bacterium]
MSHHATIGIVGLGYVGLPLAVGFARAGFSVIGIDVDAKRVAAVNRGDSYILDIAGADLRPLVRAGSLRATAEERALDRCDVVIICVPTPLRKTREPDISFIVDAADRIARHLHRGELIILESTTYPGTTEELILPRLDGRRFKVGRDFFLAFSPERVDPGNRQFTTTNIPKVVGGQTPRCSALAKRLYEQIVPRVVTVSSTRAAEMVKLLENTFRSVNIGLVNEMALMCHRLNLNVWEIIDAAKTKPFGFMPFYPGPGLGGHCLPIDPIYLSWKARMHGFEARFIELAAQVNEYMPHYVVERLGAALNEAGQALKGSRVLLVGMAYKKNVNDIRESPALEIARLLGERGARVAYHDPHVPGLRLDAVSLRSQPLTPALLKRQQAVVIVTDHDRVNYARLLQHARLVLDTRNRLHGVRGRAKVVTL